MAKERILRVNSLLKEVISEVIRHELHHMPLLNEKVTVMRVDTLKDLSVATVYISVLGTDKEKDSAIEQLNKLAPTIAYMSSKKMVIRFFPQLEFKIDRDLEKQLRMEEILSKITQERDMRIQNIGLNIGLADDQSDS